MSEGLGEKLDGPSLIDEERLWLRRGNFPCGCGEVKLPFEEYKIRF